MTSLVLILAGICRLTSIMELYKIFTFDAAHFLPHVPPDHKCRRMHGHTYSVKVVLEDKLDPKLGWVVDFADLKKAFAPILHELDHQLLNDIPGLTNPTAEHIAIWIWDRLIDRLPSMVRIELSETPNSGVVYRGK